MPNWAGLGVVPAFSFCRPPRSVLGHGLGIGRLNWGRGLSIFCDRLSFVLPTPSSVPSRGGGQGNLATHTVAQDCVLFCLFYVMHVILSSLCYAFSARHFPPSRDCKLCHFSVSCWFSPFFVSSPRHAGGVREGFDVGFPYHIACVFLESPSTSRPPRHAGGPREVFDGGLPYNSGCVFLQLLFFAFLLASKPSRSEVWEWFLRSSIFEPCSS